MSGIINRSGTITAGTTAQTLMAADTTRNGFLFQNNSSGDLWIYPLGTATASQPSLKIASGGYYESPSKNIAVYAISVYGATTSQAFTCWEW